MKRESIVFLISGTMFGLLVGWIIGSQQMAPAPAPAAVTAPAAPAPQATQQPAPPPLDRERAAALEKTATADPRNSAARVELGDLYFNSEHYGEAVPWYEAALKLTPKDVNVSTDLATSYYYLQQDDRALKQIQYSLSIDPNHAKTLFNEGIIRASSKDVQGAMKAWQRVIEVAPNSEEGRNAKRILDGFAAGHAGQTNGTK